MTFRRPVREIAAWPAWEVRLLEEYLDKEPAAEDRNELALAKLCALTWNANRGKDQPVKEMKDYLPFLDPWPQEDRYSDLDRQMLKALGG